MTDSTATEQPRVDVEPLPTIIAEVSEQKALSTVLFPSAVRKPDCFYSLISF